MASQLQRVVLMTILALVLINLPGRAEEKKDEIENPVTSLKQLLSQAQIQITNVKLQTTDKGIEIILETNQGEQLQPVNKSQGNVYVVEIPNAQLSQEFRQENPASGITDVVVSNLDTNTIRVTVTGETTLPNVELFDGDEGLILGVEVAASSVPQPPQPETQQPQTEQQTQQPSAEVDDAIELIVTATRTEEAITNVPRSVTVITREEIEKQSTITNDLGDILGRTVPGFGPPNSLNRAGNAQTLRGRPVSILIDGVPQQGNSFVNTQLEYISPDAIERVEVVRGPTAVFGQGASGGVINIITRKPAEGFTSTAQVGISAAAAGDAFLGENSFGNYLQYGFSGKDGIFDYVFSLSRNSVGGFFDADGSRIPSNNATSDDTVSTNILGKIGIDVGEQQRLQFTVNHGNNSRKIKFIADPITRTIPGLQTTRALRQNQVYEGTDAPRITSTSVNLNYTTIPSPILEGELMYKLPFLRSWAKTISPKNSFQVYRKAFFGVLTQYQGFQSLTYLVSSRLMYWLFCHFCQNFFTLLFWLRY